MRILGTVGGTAMAEGVQRMARERKREWRMVIYRAWGTQGDERAKKYVFRYIDMCHLVL